MRRRLVCLAAAEMAAITSTTVAEAAGIKWTTFNPPHRGTTIAGFAVRSASDAWAMGLQPSFGRYQYATLTEHWDGTTWTPVDSPSDPSTSTVLDAVAVVGAKEAWAVRTIGCPTPTGNRSSTLTQHWDGTHWSVVPSPNGGPKGHWFSALQSVTAIASNDAWAVGLQIDPKGPVHPLIEHWNGKRWAVVAAPKGAAGGLQSVSSTSASDVWAVGGTEVSPVTTLALHFDGVSWKKVPLPTPRNTTGGFFSIKAISHHDAWAVGDAFPPVGNGAVLTDHWDGSSWKVVPTPPVAPPGASSGLFSVDAARGTGVWTVGGWSSDQGAHAIVLHWTGTAWAVEPTPNTNDLFAVGVLPNNELFGADFGIIFRGVIS